MGGSSVFISPTSKDTLKAVYEMADHITDVNLKIFSDKEFERNCCRSSEYRFC